MNRKKSLYNLCHYISDYNLNLEDNLVLCAVAGRVCYSNNVEWRDKRLNKDFVDYLQRLSAMKHYSVFSHIPVEVFVPEEIFLELEFYNLFKVYYDKNNEKMYINLRHLLEAYNEVGNSTIKDIINYFYSNDFNPKYILDWEVVVEDNVYYFKVNDYWDFFYIENTDRVTTHQIVRHQSLNFNERSYRYTRNNSKMPVEVSSVLNKKYSSSGLDFTTDIFLTTADYYETARDEYGFKKEDARLILPQGSSSNIVISGFSSDVDKFINERIDNKAQELIRNVAYKMKCTKDNWR